MSEAPKRIWVLLGFRKGDNNQLLALAEALGQPFETRTLSYRRLWPMFLRLRPRSPLLLTGRSRRTLEPPWPDIVIGIGRRSVAVARWIRRQSGGRTKIVRLGNPRADPSLFDRVITTSQYPVPPRDNVLTLPVAMARHRLGGVTITDVETEFLASLPRPHLLLALGGATRYWRLDGDKIVKGALRLRDRATAAGGSLLVVSSPRTPLTLLDQLRQALREGSTAAVEVEPPVRYPVLLREADEVFVSADSVSMISEAVLTGKPVGLIPVELDLEGERQLGTRGFSSRHRDLRRFWQHVMERGLVGTVDDPRAGLVEDPVQTAAAAVRRLLGDPVE